MYLGLGFTIVLSIFQWHIGAMLATITGRGGCCIHFVMFSCIFKLALMVGSSATCRR